MTNNLKLRPGKMSKKLITDFIAAQTTYVSGLFEEDDAHKQSINLEDYTDELHSICNEFVEHIKDEVKLEMSMKLNYEIEALTARINELEKKSQSSTSHSNSATNSPKLKFVPRMSEEFEKKMNHNLMPEFTIDDEVPTVNHEELLKNNPLFTMVTKNLERFATGKTMSKEEFLESRGDRWDRETRAGLSATYDTLTSASGDDEEEMDEKWEAAYRQRYG